jgi:hypothetical protein
MATASRVIRAGRNFCRACEERFEVPGSDYCEQCHSDIQASLAQADAQAQADAIVRADIYRDEIRSKHS